MPGSRPSGARVLFTVLAVLIPVCLAGGLVWLAMRGSDDAPRSAADPGQSTSPDTPATPSASAGPSDPKPSTSNPDKPAKPLRGKVVVIDPGHNPGNRDHPRAINQNVDIGTGHKECDTTGTASNAGYPEARFTLQVSRKARELLQERGATVRFTQDDDRPFGPCVDERAKIGNDAKADAVISVHADGSAPEHRGFHVILPGTVRQGAADTAPIVKKSARLGGQVADSYRSATGMRPASYLGDRTAESGLTTREDLGGLNLSQVPKVFLECGNMRNAEDVALLTDADWQGRAASGIADGITSYLVGKR